MLAFKRPATGIPPKYVEQLFGKKVQNNIIAGNFISWSDIGD
jgi:sialic acid synthase SpsE